MKYRRFGRLKWKVSALGFGNLRLPVVNHNDSIVNEPVAIQMLRYAINHGVNYVDTAFDYHDGASELAVGKALQDGYREKVKLATKMPTWLIKSKDDFDKYLNKQLEKLQTDHIDFYLLHTLDRKKWVNLKNHKVIDWAEKAINDGRINHIGFSFHDDLETFKEIVDYHDWTFCQILYNYVDRSREAGVEGMRYAASKGLAVNIMQPNQAGLLSVNPLPEVQAIWDKAPTKRSPTGWAMNWVWNQPAVSVVLSGMNSMTQVVENIRYASNSGVNKLTSEELKLIDRVREKYLEVGLVGCTQCMHCQVCPEGIMIPEILKIFNEYYASDRFMRDSARDDDPSKKKYWSNIPESKQADKCTKCGLCEQVCPQQIPIIKLLKNISWIFKK